MKKSLYFTGANTLASLITMMTLIIQSCPAQKADIPIDKLYGIKWVHSHEDDKGEVEAYRPDSYQFPPSRGRRGFTMQKDHGFINYEIAPTDGILERKGKWKNESDNTISILFGKDDKNRNFKLEFVSYEKNLLKLKIIQN